MPFTGNLTRIMEGKKITYEELQHLSKVAPDTVAKARTSNIETCKLRECPAYTLLYQFSPKDTGQNKVK